jgi:mannose-6-phosphate isomerase-like protein (cupin superfamily)
MTQQTEPTLDALAVRKDEGEALWWFAALSVIKASGADTGGQMTILEQTEPPNTEGPLHVHHREDEAFFILEGSATFQVGDQTIEAGAGDYLFGPRHVPHKYDTGPEGCRMLFICTPGGFEDLVIGMSRPAESLTLPPSSTEEPDWERVGADAAANGCELLG